MNVAHVDPDGRIRLPSVLVSFFSVGERVEVTQHRWHLALWRAWRRRSTGEDEPHGRKVARASDFEAAAERFRRRYRELQRADVETALYLSGYAVECRLKVMVCRKFGLGDLERAQYELARTSGYEADVTGSKGHDLEVLARAAGVWQAIAGDSAVRAAFRLVNEWSVSWRYATPLDVRRSAGRFFAAVETVMQWLEGHE
jgi:hypothetical protein